jgi:hypothetical protein
MNNIVSISPIPPLVRIPKKITLDRYGIDASEWLYIFESQGWMCPICKKKPKTGSPSEFNIDHIHVRNYDKLPPEERRKYVRGILCQWCNRSYMAKHMTEEKAKNIILYLTQYSSRK